MKYLKLLLHLFLILWSAIAAADPMDHWHWVAPLPQGQTLNNVQYLNNRFVAVGESGMVVHSTDATEWTTVPTPSIESLDASAFGDGTYIVGGSNGSIWSSPDLVTWTAATTPVTNRIQSITHGTELFLACTDGGDILKSADGLTWTMGTATMPVSFRSVYFLNGIYWAAGVSTGETATGVLFHSTDGSNWLTEELTGENAFTHITEADGELHVVEAGGILHIRASNGTWRQSNFGDSHIEGIAFGNNRYLAYQASSNSTEAPLLLSGDATTWTPSANTNTLEIVSAAFGNGTWTLVGAGGKILRSDDGVTFSFSSALHQPKGYFGNLAYGAGRIIMVGGVKIKLDPYQAANVRPFVLSKNIHENSIEAFRFEGLLEFGTALWTGEKFVVSGYNGFATSPDGVSWAFTPFENNSGLVTRMAYGNNRILAIYGGQALVSEDGTAWIAHPLPETDTSELVYGIGYFWLSTYNSKKLYRSLDGTNWEDMGQLPVYSHCMCVGNDTILVVDSAGQTGISKDGRTWQRGTLAYISLGFNREYHLFFAHNRFVAVVRKGWNYSEVPASLILSSHDGLTWTEHWKNSEVYLTSATYGDGRYYVTGFDASGRQAILMSDIEVHQESQLGDGPRVVLDGPSKHFYQIQRSHSLGSDADWMQIDRIFCPQMPFTFEDNTATGNGPYFYRTIMEPEYLPE